MIENQTKRDLEEPENWVLPGGSLTRDEFIAGIQKAEEGPFYTIQESMEHFELRMKLREKK